MGQFDVMIAVFWSPLISGAYHLAVLIVLIKIARRLGRS